MILQVYLAGGQIMEVPVKDATIGEGVNGISRLSWVHSTDEKQLKYIDLDQIAAIVVLTGRK